MKKILLSLLLISLLIVSNVSAGWSQFTLLDGITEATEGSPLLVDTREKKTCYIVSSSVSSGATILIQTSYDGAHWSTIYTAEIIENGTVEVSIVGLLHNYIRANASSVSDGTHTVIIGVE